ncbi:hypothetical protein AMES_8200 [Amycolatopsis mediterranei S699]|uniref:Uncharacterized protein n=2 Tax=Amycolatopsis mediterranei TaxID=33910 RepID=A0A0H3DGI8_AMYMU|nr:hypothetical protein [Amycolatopsis mediterranei]ADJ50025.1 conserved hypothetical protein [Amycolatopsis mediterranei U32]AEK47021.1 hypothetical protein RAM_42770 [Amycolatopsis mediterranei S699]AFO81733.1 hypothetical protein AMES_8200 [Amycolatopsis mediterranei S699]AGT88862.1 hypothetical protein B737_8201 [Amycolatopsis mediterranei RB]KDO07727.1 hypothetical protein DV26_25895 [Amycolatopsis mediterranei]
MKTARVLLALPGLAALAWGVMLFAEYALPLRPDVFGTVGWIIGGPILNDAVIAPLTALLGVVLARVLPHPWKTPVVAGTVITGVLAILAFPLFWRPYGTPSMPGLHDTNPAPALALTVAAVWLAVALTALRHHLVPRPTRDAPPITRDTPPDTQDALPGTPTDPPGTQADPPGTSADPPGAPTDLTVTPAAPPSAPTDRPGTATDRSGP